jgi:hypothetical protein
MDHQRQSSRAAITRLLLTFGVHGVLAWTGASWNLGVALGYLVAGPLEAWLGPRTLYVTAGAGALIGTWLLLPLWRVPPASGDVARAASEPLALSFTSAEELEGAPAGSEATHAVFRSASTG